MDRKHKKCPSKACFCAALTGWMAVAAIVFFVCCSLYVEPIIRVMKFKFVSCRVENSFYTTQYICMCGKKCKSIYPCALIHVSFNVSDGQTWTVSLYKDEFQQLSVAGLDRDAKEWCSLKTCEKEVLENHRIVAEFYQKYGTRGSIIQCAYDPWDIQAGAVLHVSSLTMDIFHALFWPFLALLTGVLLCVIFCRRCQRQNIKSRPDKDASMELTKAEEGQTKTTSACNTGIVQSVKTNRRPWGRFKKNKIPKSTNQKNIRSKGKGKSKDEKKLNLS